MRELEYYEQVVSGGRWWNRYADKTVPPHQLSNVRGVYAVRRASPGKDGQLFDTYTSCGTSLGDVTIFSSARELNENGMPIGGNWWDDTRNNPHGGPGGIIVGSDSRVVPVENGKEVLIYDGRF